MKENQFLYDMGFFYELGSNLGKYSHLNGTILQSESSFNPVIRKFFETIFKRNKLDKISLMNDINLKHGKDIKNSDYKETYHKLCEGAFFNGFYKGKTQMDSYMRNIDGNILPEEIEDINYYNIDKIYYFQSNLVNPLGMENKAEHEYEYYKELVKTFFNYDLNKQEYYRFADKGNFFKADSIVAFTDVNNNLHIMVTDNKVDLNFLLKQANYDRGIIDSFSSLTAIKSRKNQFKNVNTDIASVDYNITPDLIKYSSVVKDKNILKVIQAGSYACSFLNFLETIDEYNKFDYIFVSLVGDIDTDNSTINLTIKGNQGRKILFDMRDSYQKYEREFSKKKRLAIINKACKNLLNSLSHSNIDKNKKQFNKLLSMSANTFTKIKVSEYLHGYTNTMKGEKNMQEKHGEVFLNEFLKKKDKNICVLSGCPGIGKTYSFKKYLMDLEEYLAFYISPRKAVNDDFIYSLLIKDEEGNIKLLFDDLVILTATGNDETIENDVLIKVVNYLMNNPDFLPKDSKITYKDKNRIKTYDEYQNKYKVIASEGAIEEESTELSGVFSRLTEAVVDVRKNAPDIKKTVACLTIQGQKKGMYGKNTASQFKKIIENVVKKNRHTKKKEIDPKKFDELVSRHPKIFIMIDEITGSSEGAELFNDIYKIFIKDFYNLLSPEQKSRIDLKIIVADASLPNASIIKKHLIESSKVEQDKIYFALVDELPPQDVYTEEFELKDKQNITNCLCINANAYPSEGLKINYNIFADSYLNKIEKQTEYDKSVLIQKRVNFKKSINEDIISNGIDDILNKNISQTIFFIQDKARIQELVEKLKTQWNEKTGKELLENQYLVLNAELTEYERNECIDIINSQENKNYKTNKLKFVFITSTASRGISFPSCESMHILLQNFSLETYLMELIQSVYRPRGNRERDSEIEKELNFYHSNFISYYESKEYEYINNELKLITYTPEETFEYKKNEVFLNILSYITLLRGSINTRIKGYTTINGKNFTIAGVGGKNVSSTSNSLLESIGDLIKALEKEHRVINNKLISKKEKEILKLSIENILKDFIELFKNSKINMSKTVYKGDYRHENIFSNFISAWESQNLMKLIELDMFYSYKIVNDMMIFKIKDAQDNLILMNELKVKRFKILNDLKRLRGLNILDGTKELLHKLISLLEFETSVNIDEDIKFRGLKSVDNRYFAVPLYSFVFYDEIKKFDYRKEHFKEKDDDTPTVLDVLKNAIKQCCDANNFQPLTSDFTDGIPFVTFKSSNLSVMQQNMFNRNNMLSSTETNIFNLMSLSSK